MCQLIQEIFTIHAGSVLEEGGVREYGRSFRHWQVSSRGGQYLISQEAEYISIQKYVVAFVAVQKAQNNNI